TAEVANLEVGSTPTCRPMAPSLVMPMSAKIARTAFRRRLWGAPPEVGIRRRLSTAGQERLITYDIAVSNRADVRSKESRRLAKHNDKLARNFLANLALYKRTDGAGAVCRGPKLA